METSESTYLLCSEGHVWQFYHSVYKELLSRPEWKLVKSTRFNLLLADRGKIDFKRLECTQVVNYFRGFTEITMKSKMAKNIIIFCKENELNPFVNMPCSYVFVPEQVCIEKEISSDEKLCDQLCVSEFESRSNFLSSNQDYKIIWIAKSTHGAKGENIKISSSPYEILAYIDSFYKVGKNPSWLVQQYIDPFLYYGFKFDIRCWVIVTDEWSVYLYNTGSCRLASVKYSNDLSETYAHLTNHCIQEKHPEFGLLSKSNEIFFDQLDAYLREFTNWNVADHLIPQIESIVNLSLNSVKEMIGGSTNYSRFQLFGYDLILDSLFHLWLLEINATPAAAEELLQDLTLSFIKTVIDPIFSPSESTKQKYENSKTSKYHFKKIG